MVDPFAIQKTLPSDNEICITSISGLVCFLVVVFFLTEQGSTRHVLRTESEVISICFVKLRRKGKCVDRVKHWKNGDISPLFPF